MGEQDDSHLQMILVAQFAGSVIGAAVIGSGRLLAVSEDTSTWPAEKPPDWAPRFKKPTADDWNGFPALVGFHLSYDLSGRWSNEDRTLVVLQEGFLGEREFFISNRHFRLQSVREPVQADFFFKSNERFTTDGICDLVEEPGHTTIIRVIGGNRWRKAGAAAILPGLGWLGFPVFGWRRGRGVMQCISVDGRVLIRYRLDRSLTPEVVLEPSLEPSPEMLVLAIMTSSLLEDYFQPDRPE